MYYAAAGKAGERVGTTMAQKRPHEDDESDVSFAKFIDSGNDSYIDELNPNGHPFFFRNTTFLFPRYAPEPHQACLTTTQVYPQPTQPLQQ